MQGGVRQRQLRFHTGDPKNRKPRCVLSRVFQQRRLADARLTLDHERPTTPTRGIADQILQPGGFRSTPQQHVQQPPAFRSPLIEGISFFDGPMKRAGIAIRPPASQRRTPRYTQPTPWRHLPQHPAGPRQLAMVRIAVLAAAGPLLPLRTGLRAHHQHPRQQGARGSIGLPAGSPESQGSAAPCAFRWVKTFSHDPSVGRFSPLDRPPESERSPSLRARRSGGSARRATCRANDLRGRQTPRSSNGQV